jgi:glycosyltransferase involved in cell wall biosynthesis
VSGRVLIVVQNLPVPMDRRVWLECQALRDAGFGVSVICPRGPGDAADELLEGVRIRRYRPAPPAPGPLGFAIEFVWCWALTAWLSVRCARAEGFDVLQACNPPDTYFLLGALWKLAGKRFVFDHHDLCPEVYRSRFPNGSKWLERGLRVLEQATYKTADHVITTNESYRRVALQRGRLPGERVTAVRTGPDPDRLRRRNPDPAWRNGRTHLLAYLGVMGPQDGVDLALEAMERIVHTHGRDDVQLVLVGAGDCFDDLRALAERLGLGAYVTFTGRVPDETVFSVLSSADVGLSPDPLNPLNDVSTMNKTMEYMAFELPVVAFDLTETRVSAADAAIYVPPNDVDAYAKAILELLDDEPRRRAMGAAGRRRVEDVLAWAHHAPRYVDVYRQLLG